eukprot:6199512-Pleurochrysis_carterae.AAC.5
MSRRDIVTLTHPELRPASCGGAKVRLEIQLVYGMHYDSRIVSAFWPRSGLVDGRCSSLWDEFRTSTNLLARVLCVVTSLHFMRICEQ